MTSPSDPLSSPKRLSIEELLDHAEWLRTLSMRLVADEGLGNDLVQKTWLRALGNPPRRDGRSVRGWLRRVLVNEARSHRRAERRRRDHELDSRELQRASVEPADPSVLDERLHVQQRLLAAVQRLDEPYRIVIILRYLEQKTIAEISEHTGAPVRTVETRLRRARMSLRDHLDEHHGTKAAWAAWVLPMARPTEHFSRPRGLRRRRRGPSPAPSLS